MLCTCHRSGNTHVFPASQAALDLAMEQKSRFLSWLSWHTCCVLVRCTPPYSSSVNTSESDSVQGAYIRLPNVRHGVGLVTTNSLSRHVQRLSFCHQAVPGQPGSSRN